MHDVKNTTIYTLIFLMGFGMGYWTVFVTIAAEQFGTNLRATVATTVPNFARGSLVPITGIFTGLTPAYMSPVSSTFILTFICFGLAYLALYNMEETYGKDLDFLEI
jgi:MFS transporter, putative metabolite:H+ symporter